MLEPILIPAVLATVLFGSALLRLLRAERRSAKLELRLSTVAGPVRKFDEAIL